MALLDIRNLCIDVKTSIGSFRVVDNIDIIIDEGEIVGLVGASGSGKTLITQAIMYLRRENITMTADRFKFNDVDVLALPSRKRRHFIGSNIALIMQDSRSSLDPTQRIKSQINEVMKKPKWYDIYHRVKSLFSNYKYNTPAGILHKVGIKDHAKILKAYPSQLTDIECQKVLIAMAIAAKPKLIIADEPTSDLEIASRTQILKLLDKHNQLDKTSIMIVCNDLASIANFAETFIFFYGGRIVEYGPANKVLKHPYHPYTLSLIKAMQTFQQPKIQINPNDIMKRLPTIIYRPIGCQFGPNCPFATKECNKVPPMTIVKNGKFACHNPLGKDALEEDNEF